MYITCSYACVEVLVVVLIVTAFITCICKENACLVVYILKSKENWFLRLKKLSQVTAYKMMMKWYENEVKNWILGKK